MPRWSMARPLFTLHSVWTPGGRATLIEAGADVNAKKDTGPLPLRRSIHLEIARALIEAGADVNAKGWRIYPHTGALKDTWSWRDTWSRKELT